MSVPVIALYATPSSGICSTPHSSGHGTVDLDLTGRHSASPASSSKPVVGGLSCLFSSAPPARHASASLSFTGADELGSLRTERSEELGCSYKYSPYSTPVRCRDHSPASVFQGPSSCSRRVTVAGCSSRSPPLLKILREDLGSGRERLLGRFVSHALGSCLEYDSPSSPATDSPELGLSEFNFCMEDSLADPEMNAEPYAKEMLYGAQSRNKIFHEEIVVKAFYEAEKAHRGQMRASGHPYLQHCVETAILLASVGASTTVVVAGLLHDTLDDSFMNYDYIFRVFGSGVADLVEEVSKLSLLSKLARDNNTATKTVEADRLHTMFLAMADARAVLIKLADRLHNMMTLDALSMIKRQRFAKETLEIFVPLANRLGISSWKEKLENYCFKHLNAEHYRELSSIVADSFDEQMILSAKRKLERALNSRGICYHALSGRHKSLYSIYLKMIKKKLAMNEIHDIHGLRLIVDSDDDCYKALDIVRNLWPEVTGRFKDYIMEPKFNGYRSLHTVVLSENAVPVEIQIRTKEMHLQAEFGFAAHWRYKEGQGAYSSFILHMVEWARWVLTWQLETMVKGGLSSTKADVRPSCPFPSHLEDCAHSYKHQGDLQDPVFVILLESEKMSVQELPANSSVMDLLERVAQGSSQWTDIFPTKDELKPKLNHELNADPNKKLKMGDVVELTPAIPNKSLVECRKEIKRMYDRDLTISSRVC